MTAKPLREETTSTSSYGVVVPFQKGIDVSSSQSPFAVNIARQVLAHPGFQAQVKSIVEANIAEYLVKQLATESPKIDDPFDAIYIAALMPDRVHPTALQRVNVFEHIQDISEQISFNDGLDD